MIVSCVSKCEFYARANSFFMEEILPAEEVDGLRNRVDELHDVLKDIYSGKVSLLHRARGGQ